MDNMDKILEYKGWAVLTIFVVLFCLEYSFPAVKSKFQSMGRTLKNLLFWPVNIVLSLVIILPISYFAVQNTLWDRPDWMTMSVGLAFDILVLDLFIYGWHRASHVSRFLWRFHRVHHLDEHLDISSAIRFHFGEIFFSVLTRAVVLILFAIPFSSVVIFETLVLCFTLFHHSNIALPTGMERNISRLVVTPSIHWVHHHAVQKDTDSNYGTLFSFWDKLFSTNSKTKRYSSMKIGIENEEDKSYFKLLLSPFSNK